MELWDLYNKNKEKIGKDLVRGDKIPDDCYHLVVHVWIKNNQNEYLISQRAANRKSFPLMWECTGGSVLKGENSLDGAIRETKEEIGIDLNKDTGHLICTKIRNHFNDIVDIWLFDYNGEINLTKATTDEVNQAKWMTREEIYKLFEENKFINTLEYFFTEIDK